MTSKPVNNFPLTQLLKTKSTHLSRDSSEVVNVPPFHELGDHVLQLSPELKSEFVVSSESSGGGFQDSPVHYPPTPMKTVVLGSSRDNPVQNSNPGYYLFWKRNNSCFSFTECPFYTDPTQNSPWNVSFIPEFLDNCETVF